jgi:hypothetical protein
MRWPRLFPVVLFAGVLSNQLNAEQDLFVPANDVSFTITPERKSYKSGEQIVFKYRVTNISNSALFVPRTVWEVKCLNPPHVWAWLESSTGKHFIPGYAGSCLGPDPVDKLDAAERMGKDAVLLKPMGYIEGSFTLDTRIFIKELKPGAYRLEAALYGWKDERLDEAERTSLATMKYPFLRGELAASQNIELAP